MDSHGLGTPLQSRLAGLLTSAPPLVENHLLLLLIIPLPQKSGEGDTLKGWHSHTGHLLSCPQPVTNPHFPGGNAHWAQFSEHC